MSRHPRIDLPQGYVSEVDTTSEETWATLLDGFSDASIYQAWAYEEVRSGRRNVSRLVLSQHDEIVAVAQVRLLRLPYVPLGVAYVRWGPLWRLRGRPHEPQVLRMALRALRNEYAVRRGLLLRLRPASFCEDGDGVPNLLAEEGFVAEHGSDHDQTIVVDLRHSLDELRAGMRQGWRRQLRTAEKKNLTLISGTEDELFAEFVGIYKEMVRRKSFPEPNNISDFGVIQRALPERHKMQVLLCRDGTTTCAGLICSAIGDSGIYLFGATSDAGLEARGSYLLHWSLIAALKGDGVAFYDLHGVNPARNPGGYRFKNELGGDRGRHVRFIGSFDCRGSVLSTVSVKTGDVMRLIVRRARTGLTERRATTDA